MGILSLAGPQHNETRAMLNIGGGEIAPAFFINVLKTLSRGFATPADILLLDDDGYPTATPTGIISLTGTNLIWPGVQYKLSWPATRTFRMVFVGVMTTVSSSNATLSGGAGNNLTVSSQSGLAGHVIFTTTSGGFSIQFPASGTYAAGSGEIALYRVSDETDYLAGKYFTPEFVTVLRNCAPRGIRPMGWVHGGDPNFNGEVLWDYRAKPSDVSWRGQYRAGLYGGTLTGTDAYTGSVATDTPVSWTDGEQYQCVFANPATRITISGAANNGSGLVRLTVSSTTTLSTDQVVWIANVGGTTEANGRPTITVIDGTHVDLQGVNFTNAYTSGGTLGSQTINIGARGVKFIGDHAGLPLFSLSASDGPTASNALGTLMYDAVIDAVLYNPGALNASIPIEAQVQLANAVDCHLWATIPAWANDEYVTNWAIVVRDNLGAALKFYPEYSNEIWNFGFTQTHWATERGKIFGWVASSNQAVYGWYGLRVRELMGDVIPAVFVNQMSRVRRVMAYQGAGSSTPTINNRFKGVQLAPGDTQYNAYTGSADYTAVGDRPIDVCDIIAYAPYTGGTHLCFGADNSANFTPQASNGLYYQSIIDAWDSPDPAAAIALVDADVRSGRMNLNNVTASGTTFTTRDGGGTPTDHNLVVQARIWFSATGGTLYSGVTEYKLYEVLTVPTNSTFTMREFVGNDGTGAAINGGSAGSGTMNVGRTHVTLVDITRMHLFAETLAATFDGDRPDGMSNLWIEQYEGALEPKGPSSAQCTTLGLTGANPAASIAAAILAWKNDPASAATIQVYFNQALGLDNSIPNTFGLMDHQVATSTLILAGGTAVALEYSLLSGGYPDSTPYELYSGFAAFNGAT